MSNRWLTGPSTGPLTDLRSFLVSVFVGAGAHYCERAVLLNTFPDVLHVVVLSETKGTGGVVLEESEGDIEEGQKPAQYK